MTGAAIVVDAVSKAFPLPEARVRTVREAVLHPWRSPAASRLQVLDAISFAVGRGETLGIMGRNGSGKSTLLKLLAGIYRPDSGRIAVAGSVTPILELGVGWSQDLDAVDNVLLLGTLMGLPLAEARAAIPEILAFASLERFARVPLKHYSSGMAVRLAYSVAFRAARDILLLDEVFAVGDVGFRSRCEERFRSLRRSGRTMIVVSHDPRTIRDFCDRALVIDAGRIQREGSPAAVVERYLELVAQAPLAAGASA